MTGIFAQAALATGTSIELSILMKATVVVGLVIIVTRLAQHVRASVRHVVLASTFGVLLTLPLVAILLPPVAVEIPIAAGRFSVALSDASDQLPGAGAKPLAFEVASVKPNKSGSRRGALVFSPAAGSLRETCPHEV